ncbi:MAG: pilus assembly protein N-terminal domain-containing protein [Rhodospirillaceae bacterium]
MFPRRLRTPALAVAIGALITVPFAAASETVKVAVTAGAVTLLETTADIRTVIVASPEIADATVTGPRKLFLLGRRTGRTGLLVIGTDGTPLLDATILVAPPDAGLVTVNRGGRESTLSCTPRCVETEGGKAAQESPAAPPAPAPPAPAAATVPGGR